MSVQKNAQGRWIARWYGLDGRHHSRTFTLKADAQRFERQVKVDQERTGAGITISSGTLRGAIDVWWPSVKRSLKPRSAERYAEITRVIQRDPIAKLPLARVDYAEVQAFVDRQAQVYAPATVSSVYMVLNLVLTDAAKRGKLARAIPKPVMPRGRTRQLVIPTRDEVELLAAAVDARMCAAVLLAGYCGLRQGELLALSREDVSLEKGWVFVHASRNQSTGAIEGTKTDAARRVHMPSRVRQAVAQHVEEYDGSRLFPVTASVFDKSWRIARAGTGLDGVRFHDLRHAAASLMIAAGWNVKLVSMQLGHANATQTLNVYSHLWPDSFGPAIEQLDEYLAH